MERFTPDPPDANRWTSSKEVIKEADKFGGSDTNWREYTRPDTEHYSDKPDHLERSTHHQPNHSQHQQE